jgi:hypothetical protein
MAAFAEGNGIPQFGDSFDRDYGNTQASSTLGFQFAEMTALQSY